VFGSAGELKLAPDVAKPQQPGKIVLGGTILERRQAQQPSEIVQTELKLDVKTGAWLFSKVEQEHARADAGDD
jgi:hypothetical protein